MNVAVMSLTRDRLSYTQHCFASLVANAGIPFDWWVADNGSKDGTVDWLLANTDSTVTAYRENAGIVPALNAMLDDIVETADYDVIVKVDNDCELRTPNTLRDICKRVTTDDVLLSPHILGLREPPVPYLHADGISYTRVIGGIFCAAPASIFYEGYRHPIIPTLDGEDWNLCQWFQQQGGGVGYLDGYEAWHYKGTDGQHADFPWYFERRQQERRDAERLVTW